MDTEADEPAVHEDPAEGDEHARDLEVETVFRMGWGLAGAVFHEEGTVEVGDSAADEGAGYEAETCVYVKRSGQWGGMNGNKERRGKRI